jgi:hypothetical protein
MGVLTEDKLMENLDFKCERCQTECVKLNAAEPELGYISKADGTFVGPLCKNCWNQIPEQERVIRKLPVTAFLVVLRQDGEGAYMTTEGVPISYLREPTFNDILTGCRIVERDISEALFAQKLTAQFVRTLNAGKSMPKIVVPR